MTAQKPDPIRPWFIAAEELGEYIGIRFGCLHPGSSEPEWTFLRHIDFDGIGGFAEILRRRGASLPRLPQIKHPSNPSWLPFLNSIPTFFKPRRKVSWQALETGPAPDTVAPPSAFAWHVFEEEATSQIRRVCRKNGFTVNSFLLKHLTKAIRPFLENESAIVPWMVPVNVRGKVAGVRDTANYTSYVGVRIRSYETVHDVHRAIYQALGKGEHWANWYAYQASSFSNLALKKLLLSKGLAMSQWFLGSFSNLGEWDPDKTITQPECRGPWLFAPPVLRCQLVGAGCVTFQNRLSLTIQAHPDLTTSPSVPQAWLQNWTKEIEMDLASVLNLPLASAKPVRSQFKIVAVPIESHVPDRTEGGRTYPTAAGVS